jgi:hypothetical protein
MWLIELHDVGAGREQVADLLVDRGVISAASRGCHRSTR